MRTRPLAIVTGASSGLGYELANICAQHGFDLIISADEPEIEYAAQVLRGYGVNVDAIQVDLATLSGVDRVYAAAAGRAVDALLANAGRGLGGAFLDQNFTEVRHVVDTNITGTIYLVQKVGREMRARRNGRVLLTGSIAGYTPGTFTAAYNGSKAFIDSFAFALRAELKDSGVTITCLMPGTDEKDAPADLAKSGFDAMMRGDGDIVTGWKNKLQTTVER